MAKEHVVLDSLGNSDGNLPCQMDVEYLAKEARGDCSAAYSRESRPESCLCEIQVKKDGPGIRYASRVLASGFLSLIQDEILQLMRILCLSGWVDIDALPSLGLIVVLHPSPVSLLYVNATPFGDLPLKPIPVPESTIRLGTYAGFGGVGGSPV